MSSFIGGSDEARDLQDRFKLVYICLSIMVTIVVFRLWYLQIIQGQELRTYSEKNRVKESKIPAPRGLILDRNRAILVDNISGFDATITPQYAKRLEETAAAIAPIIGVDKDSILKTVRKSRRQNGPFMGARVKENLNMDEVARLERLRIDHPGLSVDQTILRYYPSDSVGAQLLGYVGEISKRQLQRINRTGNDANLVQGDIIGQSGLEEVWDSQLRGADGLYYIEVDAHGRELPSDNPAFLELTPKTEVAGSNLVLTIDQDIQMAAYRAMVEQKDKTGPRIGSVVAMKSNGEILAWVNVPSFNPNKFARGISSDLWKELVNDPFKPLRNKVVQDHYPPGSTLKPIVALAALQEGVVRENTIVSAPGSMRFGNRTYHDSLRYGHGEINIVRAIESSSNVFFYKMGIQLGIDRLAKYAMLLGLGTKTGINLNNEVSGHFPTTEWKVKAKGEPWQPGENLSNAIGQGFVLANILQLAVAYNTIGLEGKHYKPFVVKQILAPGGELIKEYNPQLVRDITDQSDGKTYIDLKHIMTVKKGLSRVANGEKGTARWWKIPGVKYAGKTGTSQVMSFSADDIYSKCDQRPIMQRHHGAFVGYAPNDMPEITVAVLTEHSCHGNTGSVPVVRDIMRAYFEKYRPELIKTKKPRKVAKKAEVEN